MTGCQSHVKDKTKLTPEEVNGTVIVQPVGDPTQERFVLKTPEPGSISVHGILIVINPFTALPASNDAIYLVPMPSDEENITTIPPIDEQAVQAQVDEGTGEFVVINVQPGQYAVVVIEKSGAQIPARYSDRDSMVIITLKDSDLNQVIDLGYLRFP